MNSHIHKLLASGVLCIPHWYSDGVQVLFICLFLFCLFVFHEVGDVRVRFSFAGLSGETSHLGPAHTVSAADDVMHKFQEPKQISQII